MKKSILWVILDSIFIIVFNIVFFSIKGIVNYSYIWQSYFFIHFSYVCLLITPLLIEKDGNKGTIGFPLFLLSSLFFIVTLIYNIYIIFFQTVNTKTNLIINVILVGIFVILFISNMIANVSTTEKINKKKNELIYVKTCSHRLKLIMEICDKKTAKQIEKLYDFIKASPTKSNEEANIIEQKILSLIDDLENYIDDNNIEAINEIINNALKSAKERNKVLMMQ